MVADIEQLKNVHASEIPARRLNAKEIITPKNGENIFPVADGTAKLSGRHQGTRKSTPTRDQPVRREDFRGDFQGSSATSQPVDETKRRLRSPQ